MLILLFISFQIDSGLDSLYYKFIPVDTNIYQELQIEKLPAEEINLSGTKSFTVSYGDQGLLIDQGMWINFAGNVGDVIIDGAIADQEGREDITKPLFEVENTRLKFITPWGRGKMGDLFLSRDLLQGKYQQQGVGGDFRVGPASGGLVISRGRYLRQRIKPENHQGPYQINKTGIVPGSDQVYINGVIMIKGIDYLIDYELGTLTFTSNRSIKPIDRIEVGYLVGAVEFLNLSGYSQFDLGFTNIGFIENYDSPTQPIGFQLDKEKKDILKEAGDDSVWVDGGDTLTGGDYDKVEDHYQFAGWGEGRYRVQFTYVGEENGDYIYDQNIHAYRFVGSGGNYIAEFPLDPPVKEQLLYTQSSVHLGVVDFKIEPSLTICDQNLLSNKNDDDNLGYGIGGRIEYSQGPNLFLDFYERSEENKFPLNTGYDLSYTWGVGEDVDLMSRYQTGFSVQYGNINFNAGAGILNRTWPKGNIELNFQRGYLSYERFKDRYRFDSQGELPIYWFTPGLGLLIEDDRRVSFLQLKTFDITKIKYQIIEDTTGDGRVIDVVVKPTFGVFNSELIWTRNIWEGGDWDLFGLTMNLASPIVVSGNVEWSRKAQQKYDEYYVRVEPGQGSYRLDTLTGRYLPDPTGDYERRIHYLEEFDIIKSYLYRLFTNFNYGSWEISGSVDDLSSQLRSGGDLLIPIGEIDFSSTVQYFGSEDKTIDGQTYDFDIDAGPFFPLAKFWRGGPFVHYHINKEMEAEVLIREEITRGGKIKVSNTGNFGLNSYLGIDFIQVSSPGYFPGLGKMEITNPIFGCDLSLLVLGLRLFTVFDLSYISATEDLPAFFAILHPPGITALYRVGLDHRLGEKSTVSIAYHGRYHPQYQLNHNIDFSTRIRF